MDKSIEDISKHIFTDFDYRQIISNAVIFTQWRLFKLLQCSDSYYILDIICLMRYFNIIIDLNLRQFWIGLSNNKSESNLKAYFFWNEKG